MRDSKLNLIDGMTFKISYVFMVLTLVVNIVQGDIRNSLFSVLVLFWMALYRFETNRLARLYKDKVTIEFKFDKRGITEAKMTEMKKKIDNLLNETFNEYKSKVEKKAN